MASFLTVFTRRCLVLLTRAFETSGYIRVIGEHTKFADAHLHFSHQQFEWPRSDPWNSLEQDYIPLKDGRGIPRWLMTAKEQSGREW